MAEGNGGAGILFSLRQGQRMARLQGKWIGIGYSRGKRSELWAQAAALGAREAGGNVMEFGEMSRPVFQFAMSITRCRCGIYVSGEKEPVLQMVGEQGLPLDRREEQLLRLSGGVEPAAVPGRCEQAPGMWDLYCSRLQQVAGGKLRSSSCVLRCGDPVLQRQAREVLAGLECQLLSGPVLWLNNTGERLAAFTPQGDLISFSRLIRRACAISFAHGHSVALPEGVAPDAEHEASLCGGRVMRYSLRPQAVDSSHQVARELAAQQLWERDGLMLAVLLLRHQQQGSFDRVREEKLWRAPPPVLPGNS